MSMIRAFQLILCKEPIPIACVLTEIIGAEWFEIFLLSFDFSGRSHGVKSFASLDQIDRRSSYLTRWPRFAFGIATSRSLKV